MAREKYTLVPDELILLKASGVRHGLWSVYTDQLVLTTQRIIHIKKGMLNNFKETVDYPLDDIDQVVIGEASNGEKQLEVYHKSKRADFAFQSGNERTLKVWSMAIADRFTENADIFDFNYYQSLCDKNIEKILDVSQDRSDELLGSNVDARFLGDVAKNIFKSGNFSADGVVKGVEKATGKQAKRRMFSELKDELGVTDLKDEFTEVGNDFRETFGLKRKKTLAEIKEEQMDIAFNQQMVTARRAAFERRGIFRVQKGKPAPVSESMPLEKQIEMLKRLKELVDVGILTQEEFDVKKKEIINS